MTPPLRQRGVTLVELIVTLTVLGVVATLGASLLSSPIRAFVQGGDRTVLADAGERALRQVADEVRTALPNSLRVVTGGVIWIEFLPVTEFGRARLRLDASGGGDPLEVDRVAENRFDVLGPAPTLQADSQLVFHNLGEAPDDAWAGANRRSGLSWDAVNRRLSFTATGSALPSEPPTGRFALVGGPVSFRCEGTTNAAGEGTGTLRRYDGYAISASQRTDLDAGNAQERTVASGVSSCAAAYSSAMRNLGLLTLRIGLARGDARASLAMQIPVDNTP